MDALLTYLLILGLVAMVCLMVVGLAWVGTRSEREDD